MKLYRPKTLQVKTFSATTPRWLVKLLSGVITSLILLNLFSFSAVEISQAAATQRFLNTGSGSWFWLSPTPQGNTLRAVSCPTANFCVAVGDRGTILSTSNGGQSWGVMPSGTNYNLYGISCISLIECYIVGQYGVILASSFFTLGGNNTKPWRVAQDFDGNDLYSISCKVSAHCVAAGQNGNIYYTGDGGYQWTLKTLAASLNFKGVSCLDQNNCLAAGNNGNIFYTKNGGLNWSTAVANLAPENFQSISCSQVCYAVTSSGSIFKSYNSNGFWADWTRQTNIPSQFGALYSITCTDFLNCFAVGNNLVVISTNNGGFNWSANSYFNLNEAYDYQSIACSSASNCTAVGYHGYTFKYSGNSIQPYNIGVKATLTSIQCLTIQICYAAGSNNLFEITTDGGYSWSSLDPGQTIYNDIGNFTGISCPSLLMCYLLGSGGVVRYSATAFPNFKEILNTGGLHAIACPTPNNCYTVGDNSYIFSIYIDGQGNSQTTFAHSPGPASNPTLRGVSCATPTFCIAVGDYGAVFRNNTYPVDMNIWNSLPSDPVLSISNPYFRAIDCTLKSPTNPVCYAVGVLGFIYRYELYGWNNQSVNSYLDLNGVSCMDSSNCTAVGKNGAVFSTINGKDWGGEDAGTTYNFNGVACPFQCITMGDQETILSNAHVVTLDTNTALNASDAGSLSNALNKAGPNQTIRFYLGNSNGVTVQQNLNLPAIPYGVKLMGSCGQLNSYYGPLISIYMTNTAGMVLSGQNKLYGLKITNAGGPSLKANGSSGFGNNQLNCVKVHG